VDRICDASIRPCVHPLKPALLAALCTWQALGGAACAADADELWPEVSAFIGLRPDMRVYLDASHARGKESDLVSLDATAALDISFKPMTDRSSTTQPDARQAADMHCPEGPLRNLAATLPGRRQV
jgi:hypothetical protein